MFLSFTDFVYFCKFLPGMYFPGDNQYTAMLKKTLGVVLYQVQYSDKMSIVHIYTESFGRMGYLLPQSSGKRARQRYSLYSPFAILELDVEHKPGRDLHRIKEARTVVAMKHLHYDPVRCAITLFLAEIVAKVSREPEPNHRFFNFLASSIQLLDLQEDGKANFHLCFLLELTEYLGFYPNNEEYVSGAYFDLQNGIFTRVQPTHAYYLNPADARTFATLMRMNFSNLQIFRFSREERLRILDYFMLYFKLHYPGFSDLKSLDVLKTLFD